MDFSEALKLLKDGYKMTRRYWNAPHSIELQKPDEYSKMTEPYIFITTSSDQVLPWVASQADLLADDWQHA